MSELKEIASVILKHLSDALLSAAHELSKEGKKSAPIIESSESEQLEIKEGVHVDFLSKRGKRYGAIVKKVDGDRLEVFNAPLGKTWTISKSEVISVNKGDWYY
jgi:hypothetical protein